MATILSIADVLVLIGIVISVSRAVWKGQSQGFGPVLLSICITIAMVIFALVSFSAAAGLTGSTSLNRGALLIFLVAMVIVTRLYWADKRPA